MRSRVIACAEAGLSNGAHRRRPRRLRHPSCLTDEGGGKVQGLLGRPCEEEFRVRLERAYVGRDGVPAWPPPLLKESRVEMEVTLETGGPGGGYFGSGRGGGGGGGGGDGRGDEGKDRSNSTDESAMLASLLISFVFGAFYIADQWDREVARRRGHSRRGRRSPPSLA